MKFFGLQRNSPTSDRVAVSLLAVVLPILSSLITARVGFLRHTPFALHVLCVVFIAMLGGLVPALITVLLSIVSSYYLLLNSHGESEPFWVTTLRCSVLMVIGVFVSLMNNSRRRAVVALQERTDELVLAQQSSRSASWRYDPTDRPRWQRGGFEVFGIPFDKLEALDSPISLIHPEDQSQVREAVEKMIATRGPLHIEYRVIFPNGELHWSEVRGTLIPGKIPCWRGVTFDISERKLAEHALLRSEKLAAMGRLASTVAHEINNPLEAVTNLLYLARTDDSQSPDSQGYLATAESELARLADITRLTLGFVRTSSTSLDLDPTQTIEEVLSIFRHRLEMKNIHVERSFQPGIAIHIAPHELRQILTNLISNATDALGSSGAILSIQLTRENNHAILLIEDNGSGISDADIRRIFDPFFSTKEDVGTGIGLWVTRELVEKNNGAISVHSGNLPNSMRTSFRIEFPLVPLPT